MAKFAEGVGFVHVTDSHGLPHSFGPDDDVPEWAARKMGNHVWPDERHPYPDAASGSEQDLDREPGAIPPMSGKGSGRDNWAAYANDIDVDIPAAAGRDQIIELIKAANKPVEYSD